MKLNLDWESWLYGLGSGFIGGGAGAMVATFTASALAPDKFSPMRDLKNFLILAGATFLINGILNAMSYLRQSPLPPKETEVEIKKIEPTK